jgi:hypothetical protein
VTAISLAGIHIVVVVVTNKHDDFFVSALLVVYDVIEVTNLRYAGDIKGVKVVTHKDNAVRINSLDNILPYIPTVYVSYQ